MMRQTELIMKELEKYLSAHAGEADIDTLTGRFMMEYNARIAAGNHQSAPSTADDYLEMAGRESSQKKRMEYTKKALELEPDNLDAGLAMVALTSTHPHELLDELSRLLEKGEALMEKGGFFREDMGHFWGVLETRPYMRVMSEYVSTLIVCGMMKKAMELCERMLELSTNDNLGMRYQLMHLYAFFEMEEAALQLHEKYEEADALLNMPTAVLYYKQGRYDQALTYLKAITAKNKDAKKFIGEASRNGLKGFMGQNDSQFGYRPFTADELIQEVNEFPYLFETVPFFFKWADKALKK